MQKGAQAEMLYVYATYIQIRSIRSCNLESGRLFCLHVLGVSFISYGDPETLLLFSCEWASYKVFEQ